MTTQRLALAELLEKTGDGDFLRAVAEAVLQLLMEADVEGLIGAGRYERSGERSTWRNGYRDRSLDTRLGQLNLRIPKLRTGSYFPPFLEARKTTEKALVSVIQEAWIAGVSTRKVDDLVQALGIEAGISKSEVSRICGELDSVVAEFRDRPLGHVEFPYVFLDATYVKAHEGAKVVSKAIVIATGVARTGDREVLGLAVGDSEDGAFWTAFLRSLRARGLGGVQLVISDAHEGLKAAIAAVFVGSAWQRCRVHFMRNVLARVPRGSSEMVAAAVRTIFAQPDAAAVAEQLETIADKLGRQFPPVAAMLRDAAPDICAFAAFPQSHWRKIWSTNPLERVNVEIKRRADVVGIFANEKSVLRLSGAVLLEMHDEWAVAERCYLSAGSLAKLYETGQDDNPKEVERAHSELVA